MISKLLLKFILVRLVGHIVSSPIEPLSDHPLMSSFTPEIYIPRREGVLKISHRLKIKSI